MPFGSSTPALSCPHEAGCCVVEYRRRQREVDEANAVYYLPDPPRKPLTPRQRDVVLALVRHASIAAAARELGISAHTVQNQLAKAMQATGARSRPHLVWLFYRDLEPDLRLPGDPAPV